MRDYRQIAAALKLNIPDDQLARVIPPLDGLEETFRPLAATIPHETEPAITFVIPPEEAE